jgi:hypothetical protein
MIGGVSGWKGHSLVYFMDTWVYETAADRWTEIKTPASPPEGPAATAYDAARDVVALFHGGGKGSTWALKIQRTGR